MYRQNKQWGVVSRYTVKHIGGHLILHELSVTRVERKRSHRNNDTRNDRCRAIGREFLNSLLYIPGASLSSLDRTSTWRRLFFGVQTVKQFGKFLDG